MIEFTHSSDHPDVLNSIDIQGGKPSFQYLHIVHVVVDNVLTNSGIVDNYTGLCREECVTLTTPSMQRGERDVDNSVYAERRA